MPRKYLIEDGAQTQNTPETHAWWQRLPDGAIEATARPVR